MVVLKIVTTVLIALLMLVIFFFARTLDGKEHKASVIGFGIVEMVYALSILCMWC